MAKKMTVGVLAEELPGSQEKGFKTNETSDKLIHSSMGLLFSSQFPTADTLATLRQRKKVRCSVFYCSVVVAVYLKKDCKDSRSCYIEAASCTGGVKS